MEKLNSLGSSLPPEQPPTEQAINSLSSDLSQEFKIAANAVTKLYRVANERNSLLKHHGYLDCIDDLMHLLQTPDMTMDDIHLWCLKQKNDILSNRTHGASNSKFDFNFDNSNTNSAVNSETSAPKFRLSTPPLSVEHSHSNGHGHLRTKKTRTPTIKRQQAQQSQQEAWKPVGKYGAQKQGIERFETAQSTEHSNGHARPVAEDGSLSAIKKQKALTQSQNSMRRKK